MADTAARLALVVRRYEVARFTIAVRGINLSGVAMAMQVRLQRGTPGAPLIALGTVNTTAAEGLKLDSVTVIDGVPVSIIKGRINQSTMSDAAKVPYAGELGDDTTLAYAMQWTIGGDAQTRIEGDLIVRDSAFGSDNAPAGRPAGYGAQQVASGGSGTLTFGDQVIVVSVEGADINAGYMLRAETAADRAEGYAATATLAGIQALAATGNGNAITLDTPEGGFVDGRFYRFVSPISNDGPVTVNDQKLLTPDGAQVSAADAVVIGGDVIMRFQGQGVVFRLVSSATGYDPRVMSETVTITGGTATDIIGTTQTGQQIPPIGALRSFITGDRPNDGPVRLTVNGYGYDIYAEGAPLYAGDLPARSLVVAGFDGTRYRLVSNGTAAPGAFIAEWLLTFADRPWGDLSYDASDAVKMTPRRVVVSGCGSSVGQDQADRNGGAPAGYAPNRVLCNDFNAAWPLGGITFVNDNKSVGGQALSQFAAQLAESSPADIAARGLVTCVAGMNDFQMGGYGSNQTYPGARDALIAIIGQCIAARVPLLLFTSPHPNTPIYDYRFFRDTGFPQLYPINHAGPIDDTRQLYPALADSRIVRDWTGSGIEVEGDVRFWHGNNMLRAIAREYREHVFLGDAEYAWFRHGVEPRGSCADLFDPGSTVHPNITGHQVSFGRVVDEFVQRLVGQRIDDIRVFRGEGA